MMELAKAESLLAEFQSMPPIKQKKPTIMEVSGYPHYERVSSNILSFFLNPSMPHGLECLVLTGLLKTAGIDIELSNVTVEREVGTESGNRIDILIDSDSCLIGIENKIFAGLANPLEDYSTHLEKIRANSEKSILRIVLTLLPYPDYEMKYGFINITYGQLINKIRSLLGFYTRDADTRYLMLLVDFMNTIDNLQKGQSMNQEWLQFILKRQEDIQGLFQQINTYRTELRNKVRALGSQIDTHDRPYVRQWLYRDPNELYDVLVHDIKLADDLPITIDTVVSATGWEIQIFLRSGGNREKLRSLLESKDIECEEGERFVYRIKFPFNAQIETIQPQIQKIVDSLSEKQIT
jgi:hypothetical protein